ncbi:MAG TPA: TraM recognition domain-containing protein, partial [Puia sp.]|nr:TraM recognition domain-containing protein [Puia sp.]
LLTIYGVGNLHAAISYRKYKERFQRDTGFKQEERQIETEYSLHFRATYQLNGRTRKSWVNIINPRRGVLIMGSPGSGKSWFLIEPMIEQLIRKGMALLVYDFKFPSLTQFTHDQFLQHQNNYPPGTRFYCVNFTDLSHSHRCNLLDPVTLENKNDAMGISRTILLSINRIWAQKQGDFFVESSINYLAALIWFLRIYKDGAFCTLPHVIELSKASYEELFTILNAEPETRGLIGPFKEAFLNRTMEMLDGQVASARIPLNRLDSPDFYYVLSGNDLKLDINNPSFPAVLCLGGDPERQEALAPVLSLFIDRLNRRINKAHRYPCALVLDEFATVRATGVLNTIATGRSNNISSILAVQDLTQLTQQYSHDEAKQIMNTADNLICGQVSGETARLVSDRFHTHAYLKTTVSTNSSDISTSKTEHTEDAITPATLANLSSGEFIGVVADEPEARLELKGFHASFVKRPDSKTKQHPLPAVGRVDAKLLKENFLRIGNETTTIIKDEMKRILNDPALKQYIVKR